MTHRTPSPGIAADRLGSLVFVPARIVAILAAAVVAVGCGGATADGPGADATPADAESAESAPAFQLPDLDGNLVRLEDSAGLVRVVDFWATWCAPCRDEVPMYREIHEEMGDRVRIIAISDEDVDIIREFTEEYGIEYTNVVDADAEVAQEYGVYGLPNAFVIDPNGNVVWSKIGPKPKSVLLEQIERAFAAAETAETSDHGEAAATTGTAS